MMRNEELSQAHLARNEAERAAAKAAEEAVRATEEASEFRRPSHVERQIDELEDKVDDLEDKERRYQDLMKVVGRRAKAKQTATRFARRCWSASNKHTYMIGLGPAPHPEQHP